MLSPRHGTYVAKDYLWTPDPLASNTWNANIIDMCHCTQFWWCWRLKPWLHVGQLGALSTELHPGTSSTHVKTQWSWEREQTPVTGLAGDFMAQRMLSWWLALIVTLTQFRITWESSLSEGLVQIGLTCGHVYAGFLGGRPTHCRWHCFLGEESGLYGSREGSGALAGRQ